MHNGLFVACEVLSNSFGIEILFAVLQIGNAKTKLRAGLSGAPPLNGAGNRAMLPGIAAH